MQRTLTYNTLTAAAAATEIVAEEQADRMVPTETGTDTARQKKRNSRNKGRGRERS